MSQEKKYPNGLREYLETLVMMSAELEARDLPMHLINYIDHAIDWSEEFEQMYSGRNMRIWDGDWLDAIQEFVDKKISES
jgi:hypothetical protein